MKRSFVLRLLLAFTCMLFSALPAQGLDIDDVVHAMRQGNFAEAYCMLRPLADAGDAEAQYNIGWMYLNGYGLAINDSLALEWWERAAEQGHIDAIFSMAMLYSLGEGQVEKDMDTAIDLYLQAAEEGHDDARLIILSMIQRDDKAISDRKQQIINTHGSMLGVLKQVRVKRINIRKGPGLDQPIVASAEQGDVILTLTEKGKWTQVALKESGIVAWVFSSLLEEYVAPEPVIEEAEVVKEVVPEEPTVEENLDF